MSDLKQKIFRKLNPVTLSALATITENGRPWVRYVMAVADEDLTIRFSTFTGARKVAQIRQNPEVHLTAGVAALETAESYVQVQGRAEVLTDQAAKTDFWKDEFQTYFSGPDDPNYCVVRIRPYRIEYQTMQDMNPEVWSAD